MSAPASPAVFLLDRGAVAPAALEALLAGAVVATPVAGVLEVSGPGAVACLQGLLTNDVVAPGDNGFVYGAVLTPRGMIVCDLWAARDDARVLLTVPADGLAALRELFNRSLPPRLARVADRSDALAVLRLAGPRALEVAARAGLPVPPEGRSAGVLARPLPGAPFAAQVVVERGDLAAQLASLADAGAVRGDQADLELARVLAGWPRLGAEIDDKTLPQEVRFDEIGGVSYTKGCYTGQETVARVHFRGHANRTLRGLRWSDTPDGGAPDVVQDGKSRGRVTSVAWVQPSGAYLGLALLRREVDEARPLAAAGAEARVVSLPFDLHA